MLEKVFRLRLVNEEFLRHSEWGRKLGMPMTVALVLTTSIPLLVFVMMPYSLSSLAGPSTLIAMLVSFLTVFLSASHLSELSSAVPKSCVLYHFSFAIVGELPAFIIAWTSLLDALCIAAILCKAWSAHINLLFRSLPEQYLTISLSDQDHPLLESSFDLTAASAIFFSFIILCCSLRVVGTITICLLTVTLLIIASCSMVAFFHADPQNWIDANFFSHGYHGVFKSCCALICALSGVEGLSCLFDEMKNPRKRVPVLLPILVTLLSITFFILIMIFSLTTNVSKLSPDILVPQIFSLLNIPAASEVHEYGFRRMRYMLTVASVCGLSGAVLASFLPGSRIVNAMSTDGLIPLPADSVSKQPVFSVFTFGLLVCFSIFFKKSVILDILLFTSPLKLLLMVCLTFMQHYRPEPIGIPQETSNYKSIRKRRQRVSSTTDSGCTSESVPVDSDSEISMDTTAFIQINVAQIETERLQRRLEQKQRDAFNERSPVLAKSVSHYNSMNKRVSTTLSHSQEGHSHNCVQHPCTPDQSEDGCSQQKVHLYDRDVPELPFCDSFHGTLRSVTPENMIGDYKQAKTMLVGFTLTMIAFCSLLVNLGVESVYSAVPLGVLLILALICMYFVSRITTNDYLYRRQAKVPLFPHLTFFTIVLLILPLSTSSLSTILHWIAWCLVGSVIYATYGFRHSVEKNRNTLNSKVVWREDGEQYRAIVGDDEGSEI